MISKSDRDTSRIRYVDMHATNHHEMEEFISSPYHNMGYMRERLFCCFEDGLTIDTFFYDSD